MFEFEDDDFRFMESFSLPVDEAACVEFEHPDMAQGTYLGDGVWVVDMREAESVEHASLRVSES